MKLFGLRFQFVKQIVKFKDLTQESIVAADRQQQVFDKRREWAIDYGLNPDVFEQIYRDLIKHFVDEEMKIVGNKTIK